MYFRPYWRDVVEVMTEEELFARAIEERKTIVEKYKHGRHEGAKIDPWEDPVYDLYHALDRYGFVWLVFSLEILSSNYRIRIDFDNTRIF